MGSCLSRLSLGRLSDFLMESRQFRREVGVEIQI